MPDNLKLRAPQDASRISLGERWEVQYWTTTLGVSEATLRAIITAINSHAASSVRAEIARRRATGRL